MRIVKSQALVVVLDLDAGSGAVNNALRVAQHPLAVVGLKGSCGAERLEGGLDVLPQVVFARGAVAHASAAAFCRFAGLRPYVRVDVLHRCDGNRYGGGNQRGGSGELRNAPGVALATPFQDFHDSCHLRF